MQNGSILRIPRPEIFFQHKRAQSRFRAISQRVRGGRFDSIDVRVLEDVILWARDADAGSESHDGDSLSSSRKSCSCVFLCARFSSIGGLGSDFQRTSILVRGERRERSGAENGQRCLSSCQRIECRKGVCGGE